MTNGNGVGFGVGAVRCIVGAGPIMLLAGCALGNEPRVVRRDSAGVRIVRTESAVGGDWTVGEWRVLGANTGVGTAEFTRLRGIVRLPDGRLLVADAGVPALRVFDSQGTQLQDIGREGEGPGEFRDIAWARHITDGRIAVFDPRSMRVTRFNRKGVVEGVTVAPGALVYGLLDDGSLVARHVDLSSMPTGLARPMVSLDRMDSAGNVLARITAMLGDEANYQTVQERGIVMDPPPFARRSLVAVGSQNVYLAQNESFEIRVLTPSGNVTKILRVPMKGVPITARDLDDLVASLPVAHDPALARATRESYSNRPLPPQMPFIRNLIVGDDNLLWAEVYGRPNAKLRTWFVFDSSGAWIGRVSLPAIVRAWTFEQAGALAVMADSSGVEIPVFVPFRRAGTTGD